MKSLNTIILPNGSDTWLFDNLLHNRLAAKWYASKNLTVNVEARTRLFYGESVQSNPLFINQATASLDYIVLGGNLIKAKSVLLHSVIDRAYLDWSEGAWNVRVGKQRINWSKTFVWNPNDIFNAYSFFDFDYEERPGTDAVLLRREFQSSENKSSTLEFAASVNGSIASNLDSTTFAAMYRFDVEEYDIQVLAGKMRTDAVVGLGWAGQIFGAGFKGEASYFYPFASGAKSTFIGNLALDYDLPSTLNFRLEAIFNSNPTRAVNGNAFAFITRPVSAKALTFNAWSVSGAVGYDISPLVKVNVSGIWNIDDASFYVSPLCAVSVSENVELLVTAQVFQGRAGSLYENVGSYIFGRLKWSF